MERKPIILDTDPGIDDFFAIILAATSSKFDLRAITAVAGNQTLKTTASNVLAIASLLQVDCTLAKGAEEPLAIPLQTAGHIHGKNGLGNVELPAPTRKFSDMYAWDVIYKEACEADGTLEIIAIGPLTNIAIALLKYPDLKDKVSQIVMMGGSSERGNSTPYAEFNFWADPLAADIVFKSEIPLVMVGLNSTGSVVFHKEDVAFLKNNTSHLSKYSVEVLEFLFNSYEKIGLQDTICLHDFLAVAYSIDNSIAKTGHYFVGIETRSELNMARSVVDLENVLKDKGKNCTVTFEADKEKLLTIFRTMFEKFE